MALTNFNTDQLQPSQCDQYNCTLPVAGMVKYKYAFGLYCATHLSQHQAEIDKLRAKEYSWTR